MSGILVLCPTYGRPEKQLREVINSYRSTCRSVPTTLKFIREPNDTTELSESFESTWVWELTEPSGSMCAALNKAVPLALSISAHTEYDTKYDILGFIGDDHRFRSDGWDVVIENALRNGGVAYGDDGVQGENLPTQWFVTSDIVKALGWLALPSCKHFYLDNAWLDLANAAKCRYYLPDVQIEHMHFSYGKSELDATYQHSIPFGAGDAEAYNTWRMGPGFQWDAMKVIQALIDRGPEHG